MQACLATVSLQEAVRQQVIATSERALRKRAALVERSQTVDAKLFRSEIEHERQHCDEFVWRVAQFRRGTAPLGQPNVGQQRCSSPFYSHRHGYRLRLVVFPFGRDLASRDHASVFFQLLPGVWDALLPWPLRRRVTLSIVSQKTGSLHANHYYQAGIQGDPDDGDQGVARVGKAFQRPVGDANEMHGDDRFIATEYLLANPSLYSNDQVFLRCWFDTGT